MEKMSWDFVERVTVRKLGNGFLGEARTHCHFTTGEISASPIEAMNSAAAAMDAKLRQIWEKRQAALEDEFEGLL